MIDTAEGFGVPDDDPLLLAVIALAHPELTGPKVLERVSRMTLATSLIRVSRDVPRDRGGEGRRPRRRDSGSWPARSSASESRAGSGCSIEALVYHAGTAIYTGAWATAAAAGAEAARLARDSRQPQFGLTGEILAAHAAALRGDGPDIDPLLAGPERTLRAMNGGPMLAPAHLARASAALGDGRHEDAFQHLWPVFDDSDPAFHRFLRWRAVLDLAEAGSHGEHAALVAGVIDELEEIARRSSPPILCANLACARPLARRRR